jgi:hypothetical protein
MSEGGLGASIEKMEAWMADPTWEPDPELLTRWHADFQAALAQAEKGPDWSDLMARAHAVGRLLETRTMRFAELRDVVKAELDAQERGGRALRGYRAGLR